MTVLEVPIPAAARAMELGRKHGAKTILNPAPARRLPDAIFSSVDYLTPNESELRILLGLPADDPSSSRELAKELRRRGVHNVVVTLGRNGALILTDELDPTVPAMPSIPASRWRWRKAATSSTRFALAWSAAASPAPASASSPVCPIAPRPTHYMPKR
jgi:hypothetical protein